MRPLPTSPKGEATNAQVLPFENTTFLSEFSKSQIANRSRCSRYFVCMQCSTAPSPIGEGDGGCGLKVDTAGINLFYFRLQ